MLKNIPNKVPSSLLTTDEYKIDTISKTKKKTHEQKNPFQNLAPILGRRFCFLIKWLKDNIDKNFLNKLFYA